MSILFWFLSLLGFVLTDILYAWPSRKLDWYSVSFYRSFALIFTMLPMLYIVESDLSLITPIILLQLLIVWFFWAWGIVFHLQSYKYLPVWIAGSIMKMSTIFIILFWYFYWDESLSIYAILWTLIILVSVIWLSIVKNNHKHLDNNHSLWVIFSLATAVSWSLWFIWLTYFWKELWVGISAYFSEAMIFVALLFLLPINKLISGSFLLTTSTHNYIKIFFYSFTAIVWTWAYTYASTTWNIWITSIILASAPVFVSILWYLFLHEKLNKTQSLLILSTFIWLILVSI